MNTATHQITFRFILIPCFLALMMDRQVVGDDALETSVQVYPRLLIQILRKSGKGAAAF